MDFKDYNKLYIECYLDYLNYQEKIIHEGIGGSVAKGIWNTIKILLTKIKNLKIWKQKQIKAVIDGTKNKLKQVTDTKLAQDIKQKGKEKIIAISKTTENKLKYLQNQVSNLRQKLK